MVEIITAETRRGQETNVMPAITTRTTTLNQTNRTPETALNPERVIVTSRSTTSTTIKDRVIDRSIIPYMRQKTVTFNANGLRPGITVLGKFAGKDVTLSNSTVSADGSITGTFTIPAGVTTGTRTFELYDAESTTGAETTYTAAGQLITKQKTITSIRNTTITRQPVPQRPEPRVINPPPTIVRRRNRRRRWRDPIAQSFLIEDQGGVYLTGIDVYFSAKDSTIPVSLYLVPVENGVPSSEILPFSEVTVTAANVNISVDASASTRFNFSDPVYCEEGAEYAFVLLTASDKYEAWISTLGEADVASGIGIARQPYLGSLFKSQNTSTWTADQLSDIKFTIYKAQFVSSGSVSALSNAESLNLRATDVNFHLTDLKLPSTTLNWNYTHPSIAGSTNLMPFESNDFDSSVEITDALQLSANALATTNNPNISPVIDRARLSALLKQNTLATDSSLGVNEYNAGTYISQTVNLINTSDDIKVILEAKLPVPTRLAVYVKTNQYQPVNQETGNQATTTTIIGNDITQDALIGKRVTIYTHNRSDNTVLFRGNCVITGFSGSQIFFKSATDITIFDLASSTFDIFVALDDSLDALTTLAQWTSSSYNLGDVVFDNATGKIWEAVKPNNASQPSSVNSDWKEIVSMSMGGLATPNKATDAVDWQPMELENSNVDSLDSTNEFVEYTYKPAFILNSDFDSYSVRVDLVAQQPETVPVIKSVRSIAVY